MAKRKDKRQGNTLFTTLLDKTAENRPAHSPDAPIPDRLLAASKELSTLLTFASSQTHKLPHMKKFRFQLLHEAITTQIRPCRMADIGGGKGLLAYLLQHSGWQTTVIDPTWQALPDKYKDLLTDRRIRITADEQVHRITQPFENSMAEQFDLLVAMHAHGCNIQIIDAAQQYGRSFILLPCCIIGEPLLPAPGVHWLQCVVDYALQRGFHITPFRLNFKGQNIGIYGRIPNQP